MYLGWFRYISCVPDAMRCNAMPGGMLHIDASGLRPTSGPQTTARPTRRGAAMETEWGPHPSDAAGSERCAILRGSRWPRTRS